MKARLERIREYRIRQPLEELKRKRSKVRDNRANLYTQEGLDFADAKARDLFVAIHRLPEWRGDLPAIDAELKTCP